MAKPKTSEEQNDSVENTEPIRVEANVKRRPSTARAAGIGAVKASRNEDDDVKEELPSGEHQMVEIFIDEELHINGHRLYGLVKVPVHQARSILPMIQAKKRADIEVFTGHRYQVQRLANQQLVIRELDTED